MTTTTTTLRGGTSQEAFKNRTRLDWGKNWSISTGQYRGAGLLNSRDARPVEFLPACLPAERRESNQALIARLLVEPPLLIGSRTPVRGEAGRGLRPATPPPSPHSIKFSLSEGLATPEVAERRAALLRPEARTCLPTYLAPRGDSAVAASAGSWSPATAEAHPGGLPDSVSSFSPPPHFHAHGPAFRLRDRRRHQSPWRDALRRRKEAGRAFPRRMRQARPSVI